MQLLTLLKESKEIRNYAYFVQYKISRVRLRKGRHDKKEVLKLKNRVSFFVRTGVKKDRKPVDRRVPCDTKTAVPKSKALKVLVTNMQTM